MQVDIVANEAIPGLDVSFQVTTAWRHRHPRGGAERRATRCAVEGRAVPGGVPPAGDPHPGRVHRSASGSGLAYENIEQHENIVAFTVEGDDLGRLRRLIKISTEWRTARLDDHLLDAA